LIGMRWFTRYFVVVCFAWIAPLCAAEPLAGLLACRELSDAAARLACFDRETATLEVNTAARATASTRPVRALDPKQQFGLPEQTVAKQEVAAGTRAAETAAIEVHISQVSQTANGRGIFTLDNGQVWRQVVADADVLAKPGDVVTISRGVLGSYWLQTKSKRGCKVTRVR
jgi:hypothetical protein